MLSPSKQTETEAYNLKWQEFKVNQAFHAVGGAEEYSQEQV